MPGLQKDAVRILERCRVRLKRDDPASDDLRTLEALVQYWRTADANAVADLELIIEEMGQKR